MDLEVSPKFSNGNPTEKLIGDGSSTEKKKPAGGKSSRAHKELLLTEKLENGHPVKKLIAEYCKVAKELEELRNTMVNLGNVEDAQGAEANRATPALHPTKAGKEPILDVNGPNTSNVVKHWTRLCKESITKAHGVGGNAHGVRVSPDALGDPSN